MKKIFKSTLLIGVMLMLICSTASAKSGDVIGYTKYTDIGAYINHYPITSYNINGNTAVVAEDLANYGFNVKWNDVERSLTISRNYDATAITPFGTVYKYTSKAGLDAFPYLESDIVVYVNGARVDSFNIDGKTCVYLDSLASLGEVAWVPEVRALKMWVEGLPVNTYAPIQEEPNFVSETNEQYSGYSYSYQKLKSWLIANGVKASNGSYGFMDTIDGTTTSIIYMNEEKCIAFGISSRTGKGETLLFVYENDVPRVVNTSTSKYGTKTSVIGKYTTPNVTIIQADYPELNDISIKTFNAAYKVFDMYMESEGIGVKISDFGIAY